MCLPGTVETVRGQTEEDGVRRLDRRTALLSGLGAAAALAAPGIASAERPRKRDDDDDDDERGRGRGHDKRRKNDRLQDLTHLFFAGFPVFTGNSPARRTLVTIPSGGFYSQEWTFGEHSGTHMDAPGHFVTGGRLSPQITLDELVVPIVVVDISERAARDPDTMVTVDDLRRFERRHGHIPEEALVCMHSGWATKVRDPGAFKGGAAFPNYHFPGFSVDAALWLVERREVTAIGVDTMSLDPGNSRTFPVHVNFLATDRYGLENLNNLDKIPPRGAHAYIGLIPWEEGSGGPCRVIATW
jgi:kynurenine formamidase